MVGRLPFVGVEAVILGMAAFNTNARSVQAQLRGITQSAYYLERSSASAFGGLANSSGAFGVAAGAAGTLITALGALVVAAEKVGAAYQAQMAVVGAFAQASSADIDALSATQLHLSRTTTTSAKDLATMSQELVKAGLGLNQIQGGALEAANSLVIASNGELEAARAATLMQVASAAFNIDAKDMAVVANATTGAVQRSALTFNQFSDAVRQGGAVAAKQGLTFEEFAAVVGTVGKQIASGTEVGTGLRTMFQRLQAPTKTGAELMRQYGVSLYDTSGAARPFRDVLAGLESSLGRQAIATGKLTQQQRDYALAQLFGARAVKTISVLLDEGTASYDQMLQAVQNLKAEDVAGQIMATTSAQAKIAANNVIDLGIAFAQGLDPYVNESAKQLVLWLQKTDDAGKGAENLGDKVGRVLTNAVANYGSVTATVIADVVAGWKLQYDVLNATGQAIGAFSNVFMQAMAAIVSAVATTAVNILKYFGLVSEGAQVTSQNFAAAIVSMINAAIAWVQGIAAAASEIYKALGDYLVKQVGASFNAIGSLIRQLLNGLAAIPDAADSISGGWGKALSGMVAATARVFEGILTNVNRFLSSLAEVPIIGETISGVRAAVGGFVTGVNTVVQQGGAAAGNYIRGLAGSIKDFQAALKAPALKDYAADLKKLSDAAKAARDAANAAAGARQPLPPELEPTEPGFLPSAPDKAAERAAKKLQDELAKIDELTKDFNDDVAKLSEQNANDIAEIYRRAFDAIGQLIAENDRDAQKAIDDAATKINEASDELSIRRGAEQRRRDLDQQLEDEAQARDERLQGEEVLHQHDLEDAQRTADKKRAIREREYEDQLASDDLIRNRKRENEDREFQRSQEREQENLRKQQDIQDKALQRSQDAEERALSERQDVEERALRKQQDAFEKALRERQDAEEKALKDSQDARERVLQDRLDAEKRTFQQQQDLDELNQKDAQDRAAAQAEYEKEIGLGVKQSIARQRLNDKLAAIQADTDEAKAKLDQQSAQNDAELALETAQQQKLAELRAGFAAEEAAQQLQHDVERAVLEEQAAQASLALQVQHDADRLTLQEQHEQQVTQLHEQHEKERHDLDAALEEEALARSRAREDEDIQYRKDQERKLRDFQEAEDKKALAEKRKLDDAERKRKLDQEADDRAFRAQQEQRRLDLQRQLEDEEFQRRIDQIYAERDERLRTLQSTLDQERAKILKRLADDTEDFRTHLTERLNEIRRSYGDRLQDVVEDSGGALQALADTVWGEMEKGLQNVTDAADDTLKTIADNLKTQLELNDAISKQPVPRAPVAAPAPAPAPGGGGGGGGAATGGGGGALLPSGTNVSDPNAPGFAGFSAINNDPRLKDAPRNPDGSVKSPPAGLKAAGGPVWPGTLYKVGEAGEEWFSPSVAGRIIPHHEVQSALRHMLHMVRAAEALSLSAVTYGSPVTNNYAYNVNANYGRVQEAGSLIRDLRALQVLASS